MTKDKDDERTPQPTAATPQADGRKPYATPTLTAHGRVESVTGNIGGKGTDGLTGSNLL